ncbi:HlyD family secretion protein [Ancylobacter oerskovii]|uniref:HlyD family secretion protein n=1 Tax=Ancylobacter oerskovii TaxID=459519 RepID=A0ABW4Z4V7_9HYPH|nr:HlyD family secretion protein [Ancylobacter oerskovii]MBS7542491.1 HlyD family secretion protein [Ancylobacter oerskovii]
MNQSIDKAALLREATPAAPIVQPLNAAPGPTEPPATAPAAGGPLRRLAIPVGGLLAVCGLIALAVIRWDAWQSSASVQATDNAVIRAELTRLSARVAGNVHRVLVQDFQLVRAGDVLVEIAPEDYEAQVAQAEAGVAVARAIRDNLHNQIALQRAAVTQSEAQAKATEAREQQTVLELQRQRALLASTFGTRQRFETATADHQAAQAAAQASLAAVEAQRRQIDVLEGQRVQRDAEVQAAAAALQTARLKLGYTRVVAPVDGVVGERQVQAGDYVTVGSNLIAVVPLPDVHVVANYKETQLTYVAPGQPVEVAVDMFPGTPLRGHVERLSPASGAQFALLPADNATGNFTKVVQRIPVRIAFEPGQELLARLRPGMSVVTRIHIGPIAEAARQEQADATR